MRNRVILGVGQCGMKLANLFYKKFSRNDELIGISTSLEDSVGMPQRSVIQVDRNGSGKKFSNGYNIWYNNIERLQKYFYNIKNKDVVYFISNSGGSGSSSVNVIPKLILESDPNNRIFLIGVLPFGYENLPFKPNTLQSINSILKNRLDEKMSIMLFNNEALSKKYSESDRFNEISLTDMSKINNHIVNYTSMTLDLINTYHDNSLFSPFTIDALEHDSVVFSKGFIGIDVLHLEDENSRPIKFDYGKLKDAKNIIIAKAVNTSLSDYLLEQNLGKFMNVIKKYSRILKNARMMYGIIRTDKIEDNSYVVIANDLDITKYINRIKNRVESNVENYLSKEEKGKILDNREIKKFDI